MAKPGSTQAAYMEWTQRWAMGATSALVVAFGVAYLLWASADYRATRLALHSDKAALERAIELAPGNAEYVARLGRYEFLMAQSAAGAAADFRRAIALNAFSAQYRLDLAGALAALGDGDGQRRALEEALRAEPTNPHVAWTAANWSLVRGDTAAALGQFRVVVENDAANAGAAINLAWLGSHDVQRMLAVTIPPTAEKRLQFLEYLLSQKEQEGCAAVWQSVAAGHAPLEPRIPLDYISWLMSTRQWRSAQQVWRQLQQLDPELAEYNSGDNLVVNGGFEHPMLNRAWDWRIEPPPGVVLTIDSSELHSGARSLNIDFHTASATSAGVWQVMAVEPQTHYAFHAYWKADDLVTDVPLRWEVRNAVTGSALFTSEEIVGTSGWREVRGEFTTAADTAAVQVLLRRNAEAPLRGRLALDDVSLVKEPQP